MFILNCKEKAKHFNDFFSQQCKPIINSSILPSLNVLTDERIDHITILSDEITSLIRNLNPDKATGSDGISGQMLLLCDNSVVLPLKIIFQNILMTSIYPDMWKLATVTPIFKKGDKQLINIIGQYLYSQFVAKFLKKLSSIIFTVILIQIIL